MNYVLLMCMIYMHLSYNSVGQSKFYIYPDSVQSSILYNNGWAWNLIKSENDSIIYNGWGYSNKPTNFNAYSFINKIDKNLSFSSSIDFNEDTSKINTPQWLNTLTFDNKNNLYELGTILFEDTANNHHSLIYVEKYNNALNKVKEVIWGDSIHYMLPVMILHHKNSLYVSGSIRNGGPVNLPSYFYLAKFDTSLNMIWEKTYPGNYQEYGFNFNIRNDMIYYSGWRNNPPYDSEEYVHVFKKIDTNGVLLQSTYLPFKRNSDIAVSLVFNENGKTKLVTLNVEHKEDAFSMGSLSRNEIRFRVVDTNFSILKTVIIPRDLPMIIRNEKKIADDRILLVGAKYTDSTEQGLGAWAALMDTSGHLIWDRTYEVRENAHHYLTDGIALGDTAFVFCGSVFSNGLGTTQDALLINVDSNGCLFNNQCDPLGIKNVGTGKLEIKVYPNPVSDNLMIDLSKVNLPNLHLTIRDITGKKIYQDDVKTVLLQIDSKAWQGGVYFVQIQTKDGNFNYKLIKE